MLSKCSTRLTQHILVFSFSKSFCFYVICIQLTETLLKFKNQVHKPVQKHFERKKKINVMTFILCSVLLNGSNHNWPHKVQMRTTDKCSRCVINKLTEIRTELRFLCLMNKSFSQIFSCLRNSLQEMNIFKININEFLAKIHNSQGFIWFIVVTCHHNYKWMT